MHTAEDVLREVLRAASNHAAPDRSVRPYIEDTVRNWFTANPVSGTRSMQCPMCETVFVDAALASSAMENAILSAALAEVEKQLALATPRKRSGAQMSIIGALEQGPATGDEVAERTGVNRSTICSYLSALRRCGFVVAERIEGDFRGRPPLRYRLTGGGK